MRTIRRLPSWALSREYLAGGLMVVIGITAAAMGVSYRTGTLRDMGPGFFPVAVGSLLSITGILIIIAAHRDIEEDSEVVGRKLNWRGWFCISLSLVAFIAIGNLWGLLPATFSVVFISAMADREHSLRSALFLSVCLCIVCVVVFHYALQLQFPLINSGD